MLILGGAVAAQALTLVSGPLMARMLGPEGRGEFALVIVVSRLVAVLAAGGLPTAVARAVGAADAPARDLLAGHLRRWAFWSLVPATLAASGVTLVLRPTTWWAVALPTLAVSLGALWNLMITQLLRGEGDVGRVNALPLTALAAYATAVFALYLTCPLDDVSILLSVFALCQLLGTAIGWLLLRRPTGRPSLVVDVHALWAFARRGYVSTINPVALGIDQLLVGLLLGAGALGFYATAASVTTLPAVLLAGLASMLLPRLASLRDSPASTMLLRRWVIVAVVVDVATVAGLQVVIAPVIQLLFGNEFQPAIVSARLLLIGWGLVALRGVLAAAAQAQGRAGATSVIETCAFLVLVAGGTAGADLAGIDGMAVAFGLSGLTSCIALTWIVNWRTPVETPQTDQPPKS